METALKQRLANISISFEAKSFHYFSIQNSLIVFEAEFHSSSVLHENIFFNDCYFLGRIYYWHFYKFVCHI